MGLNVELLERSFAAVAPKAEELAEVFYGHLFADFPQVKPMFENVDMAEQKKKLIASLVVIVNNLRKGEVLVPTLEQLGARHLDYGAQEEHYPAVGQSLIKALAQVTGDAWNEELTQVWSEAYAVITEHMLAGAAKRSPVATV
ncbi:MAG: flavohemoprotein [Planctomycetes bacterium]|nr:flavohemoprotein [Planctomycetota bacterium]